MAFSFQRRLLASIPFPNPNEAYYNPLIVFSDCKHLEKIILVSKQLKLSLKIFFVDSFVRFITKTSFTLFKIHLNFITNDTF